MSVQIAQPFSIFLDVDGTPLNNGYIYIGTVNLNPETNPIACYWDAALTLPAAQPIRTINGAPSRNGTPSQIYTASEFSITVRNSKSALVFYKPNGIQLTLDSSVIVYVPAGTGAISTNVQSKLREMVSVKDFGAVGDGVTNDTAAIQAAINYCSANFRKLYAPSGTYLGNWTIKSNVIIVGENETSTIFKPVVDAPVFTTPTNVSTVRIGWRDCTVVGDVTHTVNGDGIRLGTTTGGTFVDTIEIHNVRISGNGRYGLYVFGTSATGPFVQKLRVTNSAIREQMNNSGLYIHGKVLETKFTACHLSGNGDAAGVNPNARVALNSTATNRVQFDTCMFNHVNSSGVGTALSISHAEAVSLKGCNFESASPYIEITGSLSKAISIDTCSFSSNYACPVAIDVQDCNGLNIQNCAFDTCDVAVDLSTTYSRIVNVQFGSSNKVNQNATKSVDYPATALRVVYGAIAKNLDYQVVDVVNASDASDDIDYITGYSPQLTVNSAVDNGAGLIRITTSTASDIPTGATVHVQNVGGVPNADGIWVVTAINSTTYDLQGSVFAGAYASAGLLLRRIDGVTNDQSLITIKSVSSTRDLVIKHNTGNILLNGGVDTILSSNTSMITLKWISAIAKWVEIGRNYDDRISQIDTGTTAELTAIANAINTIGKYTGKRVTNTTDGKQVFASGSTAGSVWNYADGTLAHTPV